jgi:flagellar assembly protein FliH
MNSSDRFTREELAALATWSFPAVDEPEPVEEPEPVVEEVVEEEPQEIFAMPTAEEIEALQREAREEASRQGYQEGYDQGFQEGYEKGRQQGFNEGQDEVNQLIAQFHELVSSLTDPLHAVDEQVETELVNLTVALTKQLVRRELKADPGQIVAVVREALAALPSSSRKVNLYLHPEDLDIVRSALALDESGQRWKLVEDPLLTRGGCRVISETSVIDGSVEKRLAAAIAKAFGGEREGDEG